MDNVEITSPAFDAAMIAVFKDEGKLENIKSDPGGITKFGISLRFLKASGIDINLDARIDADDIRALNSNDARQIYYQKFWKPYRLHYLASEAIAIKVFDLGVNMGMNQAIKLLQEAYNEISVKKIPVTGVMNNRTLDSVNACDQIHLLLELRETALRFYKQLVREHPALDKFLDGWSKRAME